MMNLPKEMNLNEIVQWMFELGWELFQTHHIDKKIEAATGHHATGPTDGEETPIPEKKHSIFLGGITNAQNRVFYLRILQRLQPAEATILYEFMAWLRKKDHKAADRLLIRIAEDYENDEQACLNAIGDLCNIGLSSGKGFKEMRKYAELTRMTADSNSEHLAYLKKKLMKDLDAAWPYFEPYANDITAFMGNVTAEAAKIRAMSWWQYIKYAIYSQ